LASYIYSIKTMNADALSARQEYERRRDQWCQRMGDRVASPMFNEYPETSQYTWDLFYGDIPNW
jgi:hypothetical protein